MFCYIHLTLLFQTFAPILIWLAILIILTLSSVRPLRQTSLTNVTFKPFVILTTNRALHIGVQHSSARISNIDHYKLASVLLTKHLISGDVFCSRKPRINSQLVAQQVAQQYAAPPPAKKERRERTDLPDDDNFDMDNSDSDRLSSLHPDSDHPERLGLEGGQLDREHSHKDQRQERGLDKPQPLHTDRRPERAELTPDLLQHNRTDTEHTDRALLDKLQPHREHMDKDHPHTAGSGMQPAERMGAEREELKKGKIEGAMMEKPKERPKSLTPSKKPTAKKMK